eukprot:TRINITY_DN4827_c0_g2_i3.p1 TRINITY_DN4827_c0_g2~~TRINITY_DN4827_c0_g2_i3.p1  ORF type:complete len:334 (-),score=85.59 TRINITY_DN4827_c0_g2_i3:94-1095(-)
MGNWAKTLWDKLPVFYGQMLTRGYITDPSISFSGVGDANTDKAPLQVTNFEVGTALDNQIEKIWLEGAGGGQTYETYELCAYFYARKCKLTNPVTPFFFFMGDEGFYKNVKKDHVQKVIGDPLPEDTDSFLIFRELRKKFHVFFIHKPYFDPDVDEKRLARWRDAVGPDRILEMREPKAIVDIMLGAISLISRARTLPEYLDDLRSRGQSASRVVEVQNALQPVAATLLSPHFPPPGATGPDDDDDSELPSPAPVKVESTEPAAEWICPITEQLFVDPVLLADGYTYEKSAITDWLQDHNTSPITDEVLTSRIMLPNNTIKQKIEAWKCKNRQ